MERLREAIEEEWQQRPPSYEIVERLIERTEAWGEAGSASGFRRELDQARRTGTAVPLDTIVSIVNEIERFGL